MAEVILEGVSKTYPEGTLALRRLSLRVEAGEILALVGPSGCGKTTLLRLVAGLEAADEGRVWIGGRDVSREPPHRRGIAMVFQRPALYPHRTVGEQLVDDLERPGLLRRLLPPKPSSTQELETEEVCEALGLGLLLERYPAELSGGEQQRLALGRALLRRPAAALLDEPLTGLDPPLRRDIRRLVRGWQKRRGTTTVHVTHDQEEALALGDRVAVLDQGRLQQVGTATDLHDRPASRFVASFLGSPPMGWLEGRLQLDEDRLTLVTRDGVIPLPARKRQAWGRHAGGEVAIGIRPSDVRVGAATGEGARLVMEAARVEPLLPLQLVTLTRGMIQLNACLPWPLVGVGDVLEVELTLRSEYLFEGRTGRSLIDAT